MKHSETLGKLATALAQAQAEFQTVAKGREAEVRMKSGGTYSYTYADLAATLESVRPVLAKHGLAVAQPVSSRNGSAVVTTMLLHSSGEFLAEEDEQPVVDPADARSKGSAITYSRRYGLAGMLGLAAADGEDDDDGEAARGGNHEMPAAASTTPAPERKPMQFSDRLWCTNCGKQAVRQSKFGGYYCDYKAGGCNKKYDAPPPAPPDEPAGASEEAPF